MSKLIAGDILTVAETARYLRVSISTLRRWIHADRMPAFKIGRGWRIHRADLERLTRGAMGNAQESGE